MPFLAWIRSLKNRHFLLFYIFAFFIEHLEFSGHLTINKMPENCPKKQSWKFDLWPLQTGILKINSSFAEKKPEKVEIITRTPAEVRPSDFSLRFLTYKYLKSAKFWLSFQTKVVDPDLSFLLVYNMIQYLN